MRMPSRLLLPSLLLPLALTLSPGAEAVAQETHAQMAMPAPAPASAVVRSRWSDPASWPGGKVPGAGDAGTIARDREGVLDVSPPALRRLTINGKLSFSNHTDLALKTAGIYPPAAR